jgi:hypothetical protein
MTDRGLRVGRPRAGRAEVVIRLPRKYRSHPMALLERMQPCAKALGDPPPGSSLVVDRRARVIQLYKPRTCLFPTEPDG